MNKDIQPIQLPIERIQGKILLIRGKKVLLDSDLAEFYEEETRNLNAAVKRNIDRFPEDFMFQLNDEEFEALKASKGGRGGRRYAPFVFTENGVAMLSSVLKSKTAVQINIQIMRAFTRLREVLATDEALRQKIQEQDTKFSYVFEILNEMTDLLNSPTIRLPDPDCRIGFNRNE